MLLTSWSEGSKAKKHKGRGFEEWGIPEFTFVGYSTDENLLQAKILDYYLENKEKMEEPTQADYMNFTTEKFDSVTITFGIDYNKELSELSPSFEETERDTFIIKGVAQLSKSEIKELHQWFLSEKAFANTVPLLSHSDIVISYYKNDTLTVRCAISSLTRKFTLINGEHYFNNSITPAFEKYLTALMRKKKLWSKEDVFYKWD